MVAKVGCESTSFIEASGPESAWAAPPKRSASSSARKGWLARAHSRHSSATITKPACQFSASMTEGTVAPANMLPTGTPVCLMENTSDIWCAGVVRASRCELAGVIGP